MTTLPIDNTLDDPTKRSPLVLGHDDFASVTNTICNVNERYRPPRAWYICFAISSTFLGILGILIGYLFWTGVGVWGNQNPAM